MERVSANWPLEIRKMEATNNFESWGRWMHTSRLRECMAKNYGPLNKFVIGTLVVMPQINVSDHSNLAWE
jgi:hypothetical protein